MILKQKNDELLNEAQDLRTKAEQYLRVNQENLDRATQILAFEAKTHLLMKQISEVEDEIKLMDSRIAEKVELQASHDLMRKKDLMRQTRSLEDQSKLAKLQITLKETVQEVEQQQKDILANIVNCFDIHLSEDGENLLFLDHTIPLSGNFCRLPPDDLNAVLGHISQIIIYIANTFEIHLPFELVTCRPITYFRLVSTSSSWHGTKLALWLNPKDTGSREMSSFVTSIALLAYNVAWSQWSLGVGISPENHQNTSEANSVDFNLVKSLWSILGLRSSDLPIVRRRPSLNACSLDKALSINFEIWNAFSGDNLSPALSSQRLKILLEENLSSESGHHN